MALVLKAAPKETRNDVVVKTLGGKHELVVIWKTPNSTDAEDVNTLAIDTQILLEQLNAEGDPEQKADKVKGFTEIKQRANKIIEKYFIGCDDPDFEKGDLTRMLEHDAYRNGLMTSLTGVVRGEALAKN